MGLETLQILDAKTTKQINGLGTHIMSITAPSYASIVEKPAHLIPNTDDQIILPEVVPLPSHRKSTLIVAAEPFETKEPEIVEDRQTNKKSSWHQTDSEIRCLESNKNIRKFGNVNEEKNTVYEGDCDN